MSASSIDALVHQALADYQVNYTEMMRVAGEHGASVSNAELVRLDEFLAPIAAAQSDVVDIKYDHQTYHVRLVGDFRSMALQAGLARSKLVVDSSTAVVQENEDRGRATTYGMIGGAVVVGATGAYFGAVAGAGYGATGGAVVGAAISTFTGFAAAPVTVPVCAIIGGVGGFIVGGAVGSGVGGAIGYVAGWGWHKLASAF